MGKHVRGREALAPSSHSVPVPTVGQVLIRALPAAIVLVAGFPLLAWWWSVNHDSVFGVSLVLLGGNLLLGLGIHRLTQAPRPRLSKDVNREPLQRAITITAENGVPPADPAQRSAAGALACEPIEWALLRAAAGIGFILIIPVTHDSLWIGPAVILVGSAVFDQRDIRRGWRYLKAIHTAPRTT